MIFGCCYKSPYLKAGFMAVGEMGDDERESDAGAVYIFQLIPLLAPKIQVVLDAVSGNPQVELSWEQGVLQDSPELDGPWNDIDGARSPHCINANANDKRFFRIKYE